MQAEGDHYAEAGGNHKDATLPLDPGERFEPFQVVSREALNREDHAYFLRETSLILFYQKNALHGRLQRLLHRSDPTVSYLPDEKAFMVSYGTVNEGLVVPYDELHPGLSVSFMLFYDGFFEGEINVTMVDNPLSFSADRENELVYMRGFSKTSGIYEQIEGVRLEQPDARPSYLLTNYYQPDAATWEIISNKNSIALQVENGFSGVNHWLFSKNGVGLTVFDNEGVVVGTAEYDFSGEGWRFGGAFDLDTLQLLAQEMVPSLGAMYSFLIRFYSLMGREN